MLTRLRHNRAVTLRLFMIPSPIIFLDLDDVLVTSLQYSSYQVIQTFKQGDIDGWPELWRSTTYRHKRLLEDR
jgi:hypothetical protein